MRGGMGAIVIRGDARNLPLPDASVDLIVTSPPYYALRSYTDGGEHYEGQIGSEPTPGEYIDALIACTAEWMRVLKPSGSAFIDLGDKYAGSPSGPRKLDEDGWERDRSYTLRRLGRQTGTPPPKSLMLLPERYRIACVDRLGLIVRAVIVWSKPNGLPESVTDRVRRSHEDWVHLVKAPRYYSAVDEIREPQSGTHPRRTDATLSAKNATGLTAGVRNGYFGDTSFNPLGKLPGSVWSIPSEPLQVPAHLGIDHFAAFASEWPRRLILGWSPPGICTACGEGRRPVRDDDWSAIPHTIVHKRALTPAETAAWCAAFADWCDQAGITRRDLDAAAGTTDMGGWWASRLSHRAAVPTPEQWIRLRQHINPPAALDELVHATRPVPTSGSSYGGDPDPVSGLQRTHRSNKGMSARTGPPKTITGYVCACTPCTDHPGTGERATRRDYSPGPRDSNPQGTCHKAGEYERVGPWREHHLDGWTPPPTRPAVVLDPFGGTGTTALVASVLGRVGVSVDRSGDYCRLAGWRTTDPGQRAKAMRVAKPAPVAETQMVLEWEV